jgi:hypothetical protein
VRSCAASELFIFVGGQLHAVSFVGKRFTNPCIRNTTGGFFVIAVLKLLRRFFSFVPSPLLLPAPPDSKSTGEITLIFTPIGKVVERKYHSDGDQRSIDRQKTFPTTACSGS